MQANQLQEFAVVVMATWSALAPPAIATPVTSGTSMPNGRSSTLSATMPEVAVSDMSPSSSSSR